MKFQKNVISKSKCTSCTQKMSCFAYALPWRTQLIQQMQQQHQQKKSMVGSHELNRSPYNMHPQTRTIIANPFFLATIPLSKIRPKSLNFSPNVILSSGRGIIICRNGCAPIKRNKVQQTFNCFIA